VNRIAITGARGYLGSAFSTSLAQVGHEVLKISRTIDQGDDSIRAVDYSSVESLASALTGVDVLIHTASVNDVKGKDFTFYQQTDIKFSMNLIEACKRSGVKRFIFLSSAKVYGEAGSCQSPFSEDAPLNPQTPYAIAKMQIERGLISVAELVAIELIVLRLPVVYGAQLKGTFNLLSKMIGAKIPILLPPTSLSRSVLHVDNLLNLIKKVVAAPMLSTGIYNVSDHSPVTIKNIVEFLAAQNKKKPVIMIVPRVVANFISLVFPPYRKMTNCLVLSNDRVEVTFAWRGSNVIFPMRS